MLPIGYQNIKTIHEKTKFRKPPQKKIIRDRVFLELSLKYKNGQNRKVRNRYVLREIDKRCINEIVKWLFIVYGENSQFMFKIVPRVVKNVVSDNCNTYSF